MIRTLLPELSSLVIDDVIDQGRVVRVLARTQMLPVACPLCDQPTESGCTPIAVGRSPLCR